MAPIFSSHPLPCGPP